MTPQPHSSPTSDGAASSPSSPSDILGVDPSPQLASFAHADRVVTNSWLGAKLGTPGLRVIECNEDSVLYSTGHIPTATCLNSRKDLTDAIIRDVVDGERFAAVMDAHGIARDDVVVIYSDRGNLGALYTYWIFTLFGHPDVRILDGGRDAWMQEEKETSYEVPQPAPSNYPVVERNDAAERIFVDELRERLDELQIIDVRSRVADAAIAADSALACPVTTIDGHIPGAIAAAATTAVFPNSRFRSADGLREVLGHLDPAKPTVVYCESGQQATVLWFVLRHLLGWDDVRVYDGSWQEWGNMVRVPIAPGPAE